MLLSCSERNKASHMRLLALITGICQSWQPWQGDQHFLSSGTNSPSALPSFKTQPSRFPLVSSPPEMPTGHAWRLRSAWLSCNTEQTKPLSIAQLFIVDNHKRLPKISETQRCDGNNSGLQEHLVFHDWFSFPVSSCRPQFLRECAQQDWKWSGSSQRWRVWGEEKASKERLCS